MDSRFLVLALRVVRLMTTGAQAAQAAPEGARSARGFQDSRRSLHIPRVMLVALCDVNGVAEARNRMRAQVATEFSVALVSVQQTICARR